MKIRIVNLDFYMSNSIPNLDILYSEFRGSSVNHVPVIRIYGSTEEGEKICLHIHRVFPYIYIPYDGQIAVDGFLYQVASALDKAINLSLGQASSNVQHVYKVCLVTGIPIYGYHTGSHQFLKLYFYNPLIIKKACTLLQNGSILGKIYQPHEAHIPYILQFMIDYNLHGMSFIRLADLKYRSDEYSREKYPENSILPPSIRKMSVCKLEADTTADSILNREEINPGQLTANPGIRALWEDEEQRRRNNGESSQIEHCLTQNRLDVPQTATHMAYKKLLDDRLRTKPKNSDVSPQLELSVYPAETPPSSDVLDASVIEDHALSSQNTDDSSVLDETITENFDSDLNDFTLDEDAQKLFDLLRDLKEDNVEKDSILSQVQKAQDSDEEDQDLSIPLNATQTPRKLDETSQKNLDDFLNDSYFESLAKIPQLDGACDHLSMEKEQKLKRGRKKRDIEKKTSEAFQPTIPKAKKLDGSKRKIKKITEEDKMTPYPVNQYDYLDGPNDSSSDDEEPIKPTLKKKCRQPRKAFSQSLKYSPLNVNFGSPTKPNLQKQAIPCGEDAKKTSKNQPQPKYKRKLSFSKNISLNRTEIEEKLVCTYTPKEKTSLKNIPKDVTPVVQDKAPELNTENNSKLVTQNEFGATLITPYQKERTITQIQHKIASKTDENETNQKDVSQKRNVCTTLFTLDYQDIVQSVTQALMPKKLFESLEHAFQNVPMETQKDLGTSLITPYQKQLLKSTEIDENLQTKLVEQNKDFQSEFGPSLLTPYQKQSRNSPNINFETENQPLNLKGESQNVLGTALITPYQKEYSKLSQDVPQFNLDETQLSSSSPSLSDDIFSPNMPNSFSSEVFTSIEDKNQEIDHLEPRDPAELYDEKNKFVPQAGTSKFADRQKLTQISESSDEMLTPKPISLNSNESENTISTESELKLSADSKKVSEKSSEIDRITPYQKENLNFEVGGLCKAKIESSGSDITPYQKGQNLHYSDLKLTSCLNIFEFANQNLPSDNGCKIIVPKFQPPSRILIEATMQDYNIPMESHQEPFYSDVKDVTGPVEVGVRILKIPSDKMVDLPEFESSFKGINHYRKVFLEHMYPNEKITNRDINNYKMSFCKSTNCIITPAKLPPSREEVKVWLKSKLEKKQKIPKVIGKKKIIIPCSPGADNDNSDDSLTISPCTPLDETLKNVQEITEDEHEDETSKSSLETKSDNTSPIIKKSDALKRHRKRISENSSLTNNQSSENTFNSREFDVTKQRRKDSCQITGVTLDRTNNFAISCDNLQNAKAVSEYLHLTVFCMELIVETRNDYKPNPSHDTIKGIIYQIFNDVPEDDPRKRSVKGCFLLNNMHISPTKIKFSILDGVVINNDETVKIFESEIELLTKFVEFLTDCDPDILVGYEIEMLSWGYLIERGYTLSLNLISLLSRVPQSTKSKTEDDLSDLTIPGRIILDFWRLLRHEIALQSYTFENIVYHILHRRVPLYSFKNITFWWNHVSGLYRNNVLRYYFFRVEAVLRIMDQLDLIGRTSELAKLFGIQFFEVLSRGSQFRVESMMLRLAKPLNYIPVSPSVQQRAKMRAPESLPLIMEPESKFYADPVIVLDFQSLYPSMIIAYNYCFSTCLGRIEHLGHNNPFEFGATQLKVPRKYIRRLSRKDLINISPCGVGFVKKTVREGILPRMLQEILDTRLMVKKSLKKNAGNKTLEKVLDARQLGLKLIANVTYGYTAANFSGRMPCIEVGDSVVSKGRETLQRAINLVEKTSKWEAKVVYGDTDSIFVLVHGKSRQEAFKIGAEIAEAVTNDNPSPVKLKLEKIFHPCILQTKKRYVGYMYESPEQEEPEYLAKGIETVRRDGCPAVSKMLEKCLKILFDTRDVSLVRQYVVRQFSKIISGRISIQDLTFAKEYRGASSYRPGACVPALELARKWLAVDKRNEPRRGERVPYVIINGPPGLPLIRLVRCPRELIADPALRPNALYYITKVIIPPINRCFLLIGADVNNWFNDMPRKQYQYLHTSSPVKSKKSTISQYFSTKNCVICGFQSKDGICEVCLSKPQDTSVILHEKVRVLEQNCHETKMICESCCCTSDKVTCISLDCPVYYKRIQTEKEVQQTPFIRELISLLPNLDF